MIVETKKTPKTEGGVGEDAVPLAELGTTVAPAEGAKTKVLEVSTAHIVDINNIKIWAGLLSKLEHSDNNPIVKLNSIITDLSNETPIVATSWIASAKAAAAAASAVTGRVLGALQKAKAKAIAAAPAKGGTKKKKVGDKKKKTELR